uniref:Uncharacterized protein n=1 Tax=Oryza barthii TaxID=65489 RepID=A0A0D3GEQ4_9ORYZ
MYAPRGLCHRFRVLYFRMDISTLVFTCLDQLWSGSTNLVAIQSPHLNPSLKAPAPAQATAAEGGCAGEGGGAGYGGRAGGGVGNGARRRRHWRQRRKVTKRMTAGATAGNNGSTELEAILEWLLRESPPSIPTLKCACGASATVQISNTARNPRHRSTMQQFGKNLLSFVDFISGSCFLWIWEDLLNEYAEEMVVYFHAGEYDHMRETIDILRQYLADEKNEKAKICEVLDAKENELKSTIETLNQCRLECLAMKKQLEQVKFSRARLLYLTLVISVLFVCLMVGRN